MTPPTEVQYKDLIELSTHIQNIIKGMTAMAQRIKALEAAVLESREVFKGLTDNQRQLFEIVKRQQAEIKQLKTPPAV
jgi:predicted nuclease with TOPRIM domain